MPRYQVATVVHPPTGLSLAEAGIELARAFVFAEALPLERTPTRYVVRSAPNGSICADLPLNLTEALDNEYALRASWAAVRVYPRERGQIRILLKRIAPRHGFLSTYQNDGCRCPDCTAANAEAMLEYRHRVAPPAAKSPYKHGAQCWKYGCHCDERKAADRLRQSRHRSRVAERHLAEEAQDVAAERLEAASAQSNMRLISEDEIAVEQRGGIAEKAASTSG
ncbi:MAG TPA: hypothetical protein VIJ34_16035 [Acidimicrobiales bacterium]